MFDTYMLLVLGVVFKRGSIIPYIWGGICLLCGCENVSCAGPCRRAWPGVAGGARGARRAWRWRAWCADVPSNYCVYLKCILYGGTCATAMRAPKFFTQDIYML